MIFVPDIKNADNYDDCASIDWLDNDLKIDIITQNFDSQLDFETFDRGEELTETSRNLFLKATSFDNKNKK